MASFATYFVHNCSKMKRLFAQIRTNCQIVTMMMQRQCGGWKITIHLFRVLKRARQTA